MHSRTLALFLAPAFALAAEGPRLHLERKELDLGTLVQGARRDLTLTVENRGDAPLRLLRAEPTCGCTLTRLPREPIPPGGKAAVELTLDTIGLLGLQRVNLLLYSDDLTQADQGVGCTVIKLKADVRSHFRTNPPAVFFGEVVRGAASPPREVTILGSGPAEKGFQARVDGELPGWLEAVIAPGSAPGSALLRVRLLPFAPTGEVHYALRLTTDVAEQPRFQLQVVAVIRPPVAAPEQVQLLRVPRGLPLERRVPLERRDGQAGIAVRELCCDARWLKARLEPVSPVRTDLVLDLEPTAPLGPFATEVVVLLADPRQPRLTVSVFGTITPRLQLDPPELLFPDRAATEVVRHLTVQGGRVTSVALDPEELPLSARALADGLIEVRLPAGQSLAGGHLVLGTDVEGEGQVRVPLVAIRGQ